MNNKVLAIFALAPIWITFVMGFIEGFVGAELFSEGSYIVFGIILLVFGTWACVRLYKINDR